MSWARSVSPGRRLAPGSGTSTSNPRQQTNTLPSYIAANPVYGATNARLDWLRVGLSTETRPTIGAR